MSKEFLKDENDSIDFIKEIRYYIFFWPWFLVFVVFALFSSLIFLRYTNNTYQSFAILQVKDAKSDPSSFLAQSGGAMFNFNRIKIDNFITQITSKRNIKNVVKALDLQTNIYSVGKVKNTLKYGEEIPFNIEFKSNAVFKEGFTITIDNSKATLNFENKEYTLLLNQVLELEDFKVTLKKIPMDDNIEFRIKRGSETGAISSLNSSISVNASTKEGDNIQISLQGPNKKRNEAIINSLIEMAHADQVYEKRKIYELSIDFINTRLSTIVNEIDSLSLMTTGFKSDNLIFSPEAQTTNALSNLTDLEQEKFNLTNQLELAKSLQNNLETQSNFSLLPSNIGIRNTNVNELVIAYNTLVLERNNLLSGATEKNPIIIQLSLQLTDLKKNILGSINNYLQNLKTSLSRFNEFKNTTSKEVSKIPKLEATLLSFERKFQIAENLYLFLLQKKEEASISFQATLPDTRIINYAYTDPAPIAPKKNIVLFGAVLLGLMIPFAILYILKILDTKIHTREDLEKLIPDLDILGEVPFNEDIKSLNNLRGTFAESSRIIRSNISFKLPHESDCSIILSTSSVKGEGKTITAYNLAASYAAAGEKVILIGADLRNPQLHKILNVDRKAESKGLVNIILNSSDFSFKDYIQKTTVFSNNLDFILSGPIPPNPAELLSSSDFSNILTKLSETYNYIIIDSAPLVLVSDTIPILKKADLVLYTTRAHFTEKKLASFINDLVIDKKINKIGVILNGIKAGAKSYYKYGYSYRYSYLYKYNYGYGYGYGKGKST